VIALLAADAYWAAGKYRTMATSTIRLHACFARCVTEALATSSVADDNRFRLSTGRSGRI
jgi:hypothetical protein